MFAMVKPSPRMDKPKIEFKLLKQLLRSGLMLFGGVFFIMILLAFSDLPFYAYENLGVVEANYQEEPETIILLGGEGMPSADGLMRCFTASEKALFYDQTNIIIVLPLDSSRINPRETIHKMAHELVQRGVDTSRIEFEIKGTNTFYQAENLANSVSLEKRLLIVTTPEHMYRAISVFRKVGFKYVGSAPAFESDLAGFSLQSKSQYYQPSLALRYNLWSYLQYEIRVAREYVAIGYYKLRGWI